MTVVTLYSSLIVCITTLAWGYIEAGQTAAAWTLTGLGLAWLFALLRRWYWSAGFGLLVAVAAAGIGIWLKMSAGWMIAGALAALINWDLADLSYRLRQSGSEDSHQRRLLEGSHLARLAIVTLAGLALASAAMLLQLRFTFEWMLFLALAGGWGIAQLIGWLRRGPE